MPATQRCYVSRLRFSSHPGNRRPVTGMREVGQNTLCRHVNSAQDPGGFDCQISYNCPSCEVTELGDIVAQATDRATHVDAVFFFLLLFIWA